MPRVLSISLIVGELMEYFGPSCAVLALVTGAGALHSSWIDMLSNRSTSMLLNRSSSMIDVYLKSEICINAASLPEQVL